MAEQTTNKKNFRAVSDYYFTITKRWWVATWYLKLAAFLVSVVVLVFPATSVYITVSVAILAFASEFSNIKSSKNKGIAESFLRKLDLRNSFGWEISGLEIADAYVYLSKKAKQQLASADQPDSYFASSEPFGWKRAMHNLQESAWWSKHLAESMGNFCFAITIVLCVISFISLLALVFISTSLFSLVSASTSPSAVSDAEQIINISRIVMAVLLLIISLGLIPLTQNYYSFGKKAEKIQYLATELLKSGSEETTQAIKAFNEYHLARVSAPLIPTWLWKWKNDTLNQGWKEFVSDAR